MNGEMGTGREDGGWVGSDDREGTENGFGFGNTRNLAQSIDSRGLASRV